MCGMYFLTCAVTEVFVVIDRCGWDPYNAGLGLRTVRGLLTGERRGVRVFGAERFADPMLCISCLNK